MGKMIGGKHMDKFYMNGKLIHKASDHNGIVKKCAVREYPKSWIDRSQAA